MKKWLTAIVIVFCATFPALTQIDTTVVVYSWKLDESFANRLRVDVDTLLDNYQHYNPAFTNYTATQLLGNQGSATIATVFTERQHSDEFLLINGFYPYMKLYPNTRYFNTRKPYSKLFYLNGGNNASKAEMLDAFHTQNLTKNLNIGLHYTTMGSLGQYLFQRVKNNSFNFFSSYAGARYGYHLSVNYNKIVADENGGVLDDGFITDTTFLRTKDIPTLFGGTETSASHRADVVNEVKNLNILAVQELSFRPKPKSTDSTSTALKKIRLFYPKLVYIFNFNRTLREFSDINPTVGLNSGLYDNAFVSESVTADSMVNWKAGNAIRLQFQGRRNNHYFVDYAYELLKYSLSANSNVAVNDTLGNFHFITEPFQLPGIQYRSNLHNAYVSTGFSKIFAERLDVNLYGRYYLSGYQSGDIILSGDLKVNFASAEKPVTLFVKAYNSIKTPDFYYNYFASNNFVWTNYFKKTVTNHLSTNLTILSKKFDIQADYYLLSNLIFLGNNAVPVQYRNALSVIVLSASKEFRLWKMVSANKFIYQKSENDKVLDLPDVAFKNSTYLTHLFNFRSTGGKLLMMIGFDLFYHTSYYADAYMPALSSYYRQYENKIGNYPYFDAFLNLQLKRFRFFVKAEHVNAGWMKNDNYFSAPHYPRNGRDLKFGLSWTFYD